MKQPILKVLLKTLPRITPRAGMSIFIFIAVVMMGLRLQEMGSDLINGNALHAVAPARAESHGEESKKEAPKKEEAHKEEKAECAHKKDAKEGAVAKDEKPDPINSDPVSEQDNYSEAEVNVLKRLSERRQELNKQARDLDQREALMKITEQRIDKKLTEMKLMQDQIRQSITAVTAEQKAKTDSLVKIYEIMKPKEAARIFDALDMPVLLNVVANMKESRVAPILAAMDAQKAKLVTSALIEKKPMPTPP